MRRMIGTAIVACLTGCGALTSPMLPRLDHDHQRQVDQMWENMIGCKRVDREALLDATNAYWLYALGVDRMHMTSEKHFDGGVALMEIDCDRGSPDADQYTITFRDEHGKTWRRERYSRAEVEESDRMLLKEGLNVAMRSSMRGDVTGRAERLTTQPSSPPTPSTKPEAPTPEEVRFITESRRRIDAAAAATRPAVPQPASRHR